MTTAAFIVEQVGPLTTIQDRGRPGLMRFGVPASGPMDRGAFAIANAAIGNAAGAAAIEVSVGGLALRCIAGEASFAVAGGGFRIGLDGASLASWTVATIGSGSLLTIRPGAWGSWMYLAFAGALEAPSWLGSRATHSQSGFGGGALTAGRELRITDAAVRDGRHGDLTAFAVKPPRDMRVVPGPQDRFFAGETVAAFLGKPFTLTAHYDRMGMRLTGPRLPITAALDMPSEALPRGAIQVPGHGDPIVLMADHQTTGGYPKIAVVASADQDDLAQLRPGDAIGFKAVTAAEAAGAARTRQSATTATLRALSERAGSLADRLLTANLIGGIVDATE